MIGWKSTASRFPDAPATVGALILGSLIPHMHTVTVRLRDQAIKKATVWPRLFLFTF